MQIKEKAQQTGGPAKPHLISGIRCIEIVKHEKNMQVDMIGIGTHGRSGIQHLLIGSVIDHIVHPVLNVRHPDYGIE